MAVELVYILLVCIVLSFVVNVQAVCPRRFFVLSTFDAEMSEGSRFIQPLIVIGGKAVTSGAFGVFEPPPGNFRQKFESHKCRLTLIIMTKGSKCKTNYDVH